MKKLKNVKVSKARQVICRGGGKNGRKNNNSPEVLPVNKNSTISEKTVFGVAEWCSSKINICLGCSNGCKYCWARANLARMGMRPSNIWEKEEIRPKEVAKKRSKISGRTMFPSTHDITESNVDSYLIVVKKVLEVGNEVLIVSKPHLAVIKTLCKELAAYKEQILFRFTIGTNKQTVLDYWEPNAPSYKERLSALKYAFRLGFQTSISCEPCLHPNVKPLIETLLPFVTDSIWIGLPNRLVQRLSTNGFKDKETVRRANELLVQLDENWAETLYKDYRLNPKIRWKESLKKILGIDVPTAAGLDV